MRISYNLNLEQSQKLIMTPELRQAIEMLQFNSMELKEYISNELQENPMLEIDDTATEIERIDEYKKEEIDWKEYLGKQEDSKQRVERDQNTKEHNYESYVSDSPTLNEHLIHQLNLFKISPKEYEIGEIIIEYIDNNGYLSTSLEEISKHRGINILEAEKVLSIIQRFDPLGVGGRNLKECLLIQIRDHEDVKPYTVRIIEEYLEDLGHNRIQKISKELNIDLNKIQESADYIKGLEPKPGRCFCGNLDDVRYIKPDGEIKLVDGEFKVILNDITGPRLNINNYYKALMNTSKDDSTIEFLNDRFNRAMWVIRSIEQRRATIQKVIESILKFQLEFFLQGEKYLKPLTLKDIAEDIEMHESTISRTTNDKYVQTPKGLFELKYFFSSSLIGKDGDVSSTSIKSILKEIIDKEDSKKPYSDQKISELLKLKGIDISRRTVAKYRDELNILPSSKRRRF